MERRPFKVLRSWGSRCGLLGGRAPGPATATLTLLLCGSLVCYAIALVQRPAAPAAPGAQPGAPAGHALVRLHKPVRTSPPGFPSRSVASGDTPPRLPRPSLMLPRGAGLLPDSPPPAHLLRCALPAHGGGPPLTAARCAAPPQPTLLFQPADLREARDVLARPSMMLPAIATALRPPSPTPAHTAQVWVTGYDLAGQTATGAAAGPGVCAVDPSFIVLGSRITIAGVGSCLAQDTGPEVVGEHVDFWVPDSLTAYAITGWHSASW